VEDGGRVYEVTKVWKGKESESASEREREQRRVEYERVEVGT